MTCRRCHGLMVEIMPLVWSSADFEPVGPEEREMDAWQCLNCGNYVDAVILAHRTASTAVAVPS